MRVEVPDGSTLRDVLRVLAQRSNEFEPLACAARDEWLWGQLLVHVKGEMVRLDERLHEGDCLELLPPIAGGDAPLTPTLSQRERGCWSASPLMRTPHPRFARPLP